LATPH